MDETANSKHGNVLGEWSRLPCRHDCVGSVDALKTLACHVWGLETRQLMEPNGSWSEVV